MLGILTTVATALLVVDNGPAAGLQALPSLTGEWVLTATKDAHGADPASPSCTMIIQSDGRVVYRVNQTVTNQGTLVAGRDGKGTCDLKLSDGRALLAIYELDREVLTICFDEAGKTRPAALTPCGTQWAERWERPR